MCKSLSSFIQGYIPENKDLNTIDVPRCTPANIDSKRKQISELSHYRTEIVRQER